MNEFLVVKTLSICYGVCCCTQLIAFYLQYRENRDEEGLGWWTLGSACMVFGFLLNLFRDIPFAKNIIPLIYSASFVLCFLFLYIGIAKFNGTKCFLKQALAFCALTLLASCYFSFVDDNLPVRRAVVSFACAVLSLLSSFALTNKDSTRPALTTQFLKLTFTFNAFWLLALSLLPLWAGSDIAFLRRPMPLVLTYFLIITTSTLWTFGLIMLVNQKLSDKLRTSKLFLESTLNGLSANIALIDGSGKIVLVNQAWRDFASANGISPEYVSEGINYLNVCDSACSECTLDASNFSQGMKDVLNGKESTYTMEYACHSHNKARWFLGRITPFPVQGSKMIVVAHEDITERKLMEIALEESNRKLELMTNEDPLTHISNRRHFDTMLTYECNRHVRSGATLSILLFDIDYFKNYNDTYGHVTGDECLQSIAGTIAHCLKRPTDFAARYGGEEFVCLLPETNLIGAVGVAESIRKAVFELGIPHADSQAADVVTVSIGVVSALCDATTTPTQLVQQADTLLYQAKHEGRNRVAFTAGHDDAYVRHTSANTGTLRVIWDADYLSGNAHLDQQHMELVTLVNNLLQQIFLSESDAGLNQQLHDILLHVAKHFSDEEETLRSIGYPDVDGHADEHNHLLQKCSEMLERNSDAAIPSVEILQCVVHDLVLNHMFKADSKYHSFFKKH